MKKLALLLALGCIFTLTAQTEIEKVSETISKSEIEGHIYFLADDHLKGRETGSPELKIAASYLANSFRGYGVKPNPKTGTYYQEVKLKRTSPPKNASITINNQIIDDFVITRAKAMTENQEAVFLNYGLEEDYKGKNVKGKVIVVKAGSPETTAPRAAFRLLATKEKLAKEHGVLAIIELLQVDDGMWRSINQNFNGPRLSVHLGTDDQSTDGEIAYVWVIDNDGKMSEKFSSAKKITSEINMSGKQEDTVISQNVIGVVEGTDDKLKEEYIIYSA